MNYLVNFLFKYFYILKINIYKLSFLGIEYGSNLKTYGNVKIFGSRNKIFIGNNCSFNEGVILSSNAVIKIGDNVTISSYSVLHTGLLDYKMFPKKVHIYKPIVIGNNVWISSHCVISGGVTIGDNVVVGANSFVNKDLESGYFYAGSPVRKIRKLN